MTLRETDEMYMQRSAKVTVREATTVSYTHLHSGFPESDGSFRIQPLVEAEGAGGPLPVSYTHLDVYKRQP